MHRIDGHVWLAGASLMLVDLLFAPHLSMFAMTEEGKDILGVHPAVSAWLTRIEARTSIQATTRERPLA